MREIKTPGLVMVFHHSRLKLDRKLGNLVMYFIFYHTIHHDNTYTMTIHYTETICQVYISARVKFILAFSVTLTQDTPSLDRT